MIGPIVLGSVGIAFLAVGLSIRQHAAISAVLLGLGVGALSYVSMLQFTDDPVGFVVDFVGRTVG